MVREINYTTSKRENSTHPTTLRRSKRNQLTLLLYIQERKFNPLYYSTSQRENSTHPTTVYSISQRETSTHPTTLHPREKIQPTLLQYSILHIPERRSTHPSYLRPREKIRTTLLLHILERENSTHPTPPHPRKRNYSR